MTEQSPVRCRGTRSRHSVDEKKILTRPNKISWETKKNSRKFLELLWRPKVIKMANPVKIEHGIIEQPHLIDKRQTELQLQLYDE